nr:DinB family protein [Arthrobacter sp. zg-Y820]
MELQFQVFLDDHRGALYDCLDGMTETEVRSRLVPSKTTLLGLVKHATFVEQVWFNEAITCLSRAEIGCPAGPDESFDLTPEDTIASVRAAYSLACSASRAAAAGRGIHDVVHGNRRGPLPMRWIYLHVLRELAQHCGHADVLREQIIAARGVARA